MGELSKTAVLFALGATLKDAHKKLTLSQEVLVHIDSDALSEPDVQEKLQHLDFASQDISGVAQVLLDIANEREHKIDQSLADLRPVDLSERLINLAKSAT